MQTNLLASLMTVRQGSGLASSDSSEELTQIDPYLLSYVCRYVQIDVDTYISRYV
jgi:hypothetical protein